MSERTKIVLVYVITALFLVVNFYLILEKNVFPSDADAPLDPTVENGRRSSNMNPKPCTIVPIDVELEGEHDRDNQHEERVRIGKNRRKTVRPTFNTIEIKVLGTALQIEVRKRHYPGCLQIRRRPFLSYRSE